MGEALKIHLTYEDYKACPEDGQRYEILEGDIAVTPTPVPRHQELVLRLVLVLHRWIEQGAGGKVYLSPLTVLLADDTVVEPDLFWIAPRSIAVIGEDIVRGAPDLVVEVLSPSTASRDRGTKAKVYAKFGVREYWLIDLSGESVTILVLRGKRFRPHASGTGHRPLESALDPALKLVPAELFRRP
jgi:Uma2 family endonuclease